MITAKRYTCCNQVNVFWREEDLPDPPYGPRTVTLDIQLVDGDCIVCDLGKSLGRKPGQREDEPIDAECLAGRHDFELDADRLLGTKSRPGEQIYGTGGWDLSFHCIRKPCRAAKYTTYGFTLIYLSDAVGTEIYDWGRSPAEFDY